MNENYGVSIWKRAKNNVECHHNADEINSRLMFESIELGQITLDINAGQEMDLSQMTAIKLCEELEVLLSFE